MDLERYARVAYLGALCLAFSCRPHRTANPLVLYPGSPEGHGALLQGKLAMDGYCLYVISEGGERWLAAFPWPGTSWNSENLSVQVRDKALRVGATSRFAGGESKGPGGVAWVQAPGAECDESKIWFVTSLGEP